MTIALGLLGGDGIVLAADGQLTAGDWKLAHGKIWRSSHRLEPLDGPPLVGSLVMTGSGVMATLEAMWSALSPALHDAPALETLEGNLKTRLRTFYKEHIIPFAAFPPNERPWAEVILGATYSNFQHALWRAESTPLVSGTPYCALGSGSLLALTTLNRCFRLPILGMAETACLAGHVLQIVKSADTNCGKQTDIACLQHGQVVHLTRGVRLAIEKASEQFGYTAEAFGLRRAFGDTSQDVHALIDNAGFVQARDQVASELQVLFQPITPTDELRA